jgi:hypothetical protein
MAWEWSHSADAYEYARDRLYKLSCQKLRVIWAEWQVKLAEPEEDTGWDQWDQEVYDAALKEATELTKKASYKQILADDVWDWMVDQATCDNGGFNAWCCPYGCGCHTVPFGPARRS